MNKKDFTSIYVIINRNNNKFLTKDGMWCDSWFDARKFLSKEKAIWKIKMIGKLGIKLLEIQIKYNTYCNKEENEMSYGRNPYYINSDGKNLYLNGQLVSEKVINAFLYKVLLKNRRSELKLRLRKGKQIWVNALIDNVISEEDEDEARVNIIDSEMLELLSYEDDILKQLMGEEYDR